MSTINILKIANFYGKIKLIFSSSCTVYGKQEISPISEITILNPSLNPYGETKKMCEKIISDYSLSNKHFKFCCLRYFNPAGAHKSNLLGEDPLSVAQNLVPAICSALKKDISIPIYGKNYKTRDGTCIRDFIHVQDIARAHIKAIKYLNRTKKQNLSNFINLGSGKGLTVLEVIKSFEKVNNVKINKKYVPRRSGDIDKIWTKIDLAKKKLGWTIKYSIDDIVRTAYLWSKKN